MHHLYQTPFNPILFSPHIEHDELMIMTTCWHKLENPFELSTWRSRNTSGQIRLTKWKSFTVHWPLFLASLTRIELSVNAAKREIHTTTLPQLHWRTFTLVCLSVIMGVGAQYWTVDARWLAAGGNRDVVGVFVSQCRGGGAAWRQLCKTQDKRSHAQSAHVEWLAADIRRLYIERSSSQSHNQLCVIDSVCWNVSC